MYKEIRLIAVDMVRDKGLINLSRLALCERAKIPDGSFCHVMGCTFTEFVATLRAEGVTGPPGKVGKTRTDPALRSEHILGVALELAKRGNYTTVTRSQIAEAAGVSESLVSMRLGNQTDTRRAIIRAAVRLELVEVVAQGLANRDPQAQKAPQELKDQAATLIANS